MIAALCHAAGIFDPDIGKEYEVTMIVIVKTWAASEKEARSLVDRTSNWDDWHLSDILNIKLTGKVD